MTEPSTNTPQAGTPAPAAKQDTRSVSSKGEAVTAALLAALAGGGATYLMSGSSENPLETPAQARKRKLKNALFGSLAAGGAYALADAATGNAVTNTLRGVFAGPREKGKDEKAEDSGRKNMDASTQLLVGGSSAVAGGFVGDKGTKMLQDQLAANKGNNPVKAVNGNFNPELIRNKIMNGALGANDPSLKALAALDGGSELIAVLSQSTPNKKMVDEAIKRVSNLKMSPNASPEARAIWKSWGGTHDQALKDALNMLAGTDATVGGDVLAKRISKTYNRPSRIGPGTTRMGASGLLGLLAAWLGLKAAPHFTGKDTIVTSGGEPIEKYTLD